MDPLLVELEAQLRERWEDDELWAVYADALLAHGDPRGELISLELRLARQGEDASLRAAIAALQFQHEHDWKPAHVDDARLTVQRGFVTRYRSRELTEAEDVELLEYTLSTSHLRMLQRLELRASDYAQPELSRALARFEPGSLRALQIAYTPVGDVIASSRSLFPRTLVELDLRTTKLGDEALVQLLERLPPLRRLYLQYNQIGALGAEHLARCPALAQLEHLDLRGNPLTVAGARWLAASDHLRSLNTLVLDRRDIGQHGMEALGEAARLPASVTHFWRARARQAWAAEHE